MARPSTVRELAAACGAEVVAGDPNCVIHGAANTDEAQANQLTYVASDKYAAKLPQIRASAVIVPKSLATATAGAGTALLATTDPELAFILCLRHLYPPAPRSGEINARAEIHPTAAIGENTSIGAFATVGAHSIVGKNCVLHPGCRIGEGVTIGDGCVLHPNVVLCDGVTLGERVTIHAGTVIGSDGFGYKFRNGEHVKFPQVGTVAIGADVEIGANTCIDRAALGITRVGDGTKIDNLVHVAHNVRIGNAALLLGQVGIGGSTVIGDYAILASQSGVSDHLTVGTGAIVLAKSGVTKDVAPKDHVMGFPAANRRETLHQIAVLRRIAGKAEAIDELVALLPGLRDSQSTKK